MAADEIEKILKAQPNNETALLIKGSIAHEEGRDRPGLGNVSAGSESESKKRLERILI